MIHWYTDDDYDIIFEDIKACAEIYGFDGYGYLRIKNDGTGFYELHGKDYIIFIDESKFTEILTNIYEQ